MGRETDTRGRVPPGLELPPLPSGIQRLLRLASVDDAFRDMLVRRRGELARLLRIELTETEEAVLAAIPGRKLAQMAERLAPREVGRREFLRRLAGAAVMIVGGGALAACNPRRTAGDAQPVEVAGEPDRDARVIVEEAGPRRVHKTDNFYGIKGPRVMPDPHMAREVREYYKKKWRPCVPSEDGPYMPQNADDKPRCEEKKPKPVGKVQGPGVMFGYGGVGLEPAGKKNSKPKSARGAWVMPAGFLK